MLPDTQPWDALPTRSPLFGAFEHTTAYNGKVNTRDNTRLIDTDMAQGCTLISIVQVPAKVRRLCSAAHPARYMFKLGQAKPHELYPLRCPHGPRTLVVCIPRPRIGWERLKAHGEEPKRAGPYT